MLCRLSVISYSIAAAAVLGGLGYVTAAPGSAGKREDRPPAAEAIRAAGPVRTAPNEEMHDCAFSKNVLELVGATASSDELLVELRLHKGSESTFRNERSAPRVKLLRDGCAVAPPHVVGVVDATSARGSMLRVPTAELSDGRLDLSFTVEGAEQVLLLRKDRTRVVIETDDERYPDGNTEIGGVAQPCGESQ